MEPTQVYSVSDFQAVCNQIMETAFSGVVVEGEVASFKVNQGKFVFFDLKDEQSSVGCFMMKFALRFPLEDGMKIRVRAVPKLTNWGKFSLTVQAIMPVGEGSLKKSFLKGVSLSVTTCHGTLSRRGNGQMRRSLSGRLLWIFSLHLLSF